MSNRRDKRPLQWKRTGMYWFNYFFVALLVLASHVQYVRALDTEETPARKVPNDVASFVPNNYYVRTFSVGDLNRDKYKKDVALVLSHENEEKDYNQDEVDRKYGGVPQYPRVLLLLLRQKDGTFKKALMDKRVSPCAICYGLFHDSDKIVRKNGFFTLESYYHYSSPGIGWKNDTKYITFRFNRSKNTWYLHKVSREGIGGDSSSNRNEENKEKK